MQPAGLRTALAVLTAALAVLCAACGSSPPPGPEPVRSQYETATGRHIARDCGFSVPLAQPAGRSLWLFCDTVVTTRQGRPTGILILGAGTAAEGSGTPGRGPGTLTELTTPGTGGPAGGLLPARAGPKPFLPVPAGLTLPDSVLPCTGPGAYPARWVTGAAREPGSSGRVLISYADVCVSGLDVFTLESFGLIGYDPAANTLGPPVQVLTAQAGQELPSGQAFGSLIFLGGYLYLFGWCGTGCGRGGVFLARTRASAGWWDNGFTYRYWTGRGWSADLAQAAPLTGPGPLAMSAGDYAADGHGLVMVEQTSPAGGFSLWQAAAPTGPWRKTATGRVPCTAGQPRAGQARGDQPGAGQPRAGQPRGDQSRGAQQSSDLCRALIGHPELSDRSDLLVTFFNPGTDHVEALAVPWPVTGR